MAKAPSIPCWSVYLLRTERNALYTGITTDLPRRLAQHRRQRAGGAKFTRGCCTLELVYKCELGGRSLALRVEGGLKRLSKGQKERLVAAAPQRAELLQWLGLAAAH